MRVPKSARFRQLYYRFAHLEYAELLALRLLVTGL